MGSASLQSAQSWREYPTDAAVFEYNSIFSQWPPPPRPTPIIVPSHLTSTAAREPAELGTSNTASGGLASTPAGHSTPVAETTEAKGKAKPGRHTKSSLHRAVMERLEVQKAINDLTGEGG